jgi:hypothetical protein
LTGIRQPLSLPRVWGPADRPQPAALQVDPFRVELGSFGPNPIQEEINGSLSMPLFGFGIRCDAVEC